jgi:hypothetical protein
MSQMTAPSSDRHCSVIWHAWRDDGSVMCLVLNANLA